MCVEFARVVWAELVKVDKEEDNPPSRFEPKSVRHLDDKHSLTLQDGRSSTQVLTEYELCIYTRLVPGLTPRGTGEKNGIVLGVLG
jgi:hypothetical protein